MNSRIQPFTTSKHAQAIGMPGCRYYSLSRLRSFGIRQHADPQPSNEGANAGAPDADVDEIRNF